MLISIIIEIFYMLSQDVWNDDFVVSNKTGYIGNLLWKYFNNFNKMEFIVFLLD